jgi:predicted NBD/HSP70 family sugar kinase
MDRYIGLDVHAQTTTLAVMSAKGKHVTEKVIETHGKLLVETIGSMAGDLHVCLRPSLRLCALGAPTETLVLRDPARRMVPPLSGEHIEV